MPSLIESNLLGTYDPAQISVWVAGIKISGFGKDFIKLTATSPEFNDDVGVDGEIVRWPTNDYTADLLISLLPVSPSNALFQALLLADRLTGGNIFSVVIKDVGQGIGLAANVFTDTMIMPLAWIKKEADVVYRDGIELRVWPIKVGLYYPILTGTGLLS